MAHGRCNYLPDESKVRIITVPMRRERRNPVDSLRQPHEDECVDSALMVRGTGRKACANWRTTRRIITLNHEPSASSNSFSMSSSSTTTVLKPSGSVTAVILVPIPGTGPGGRVTCKRAILSGPVSTVTSRTQRRVEEQHPRGPPR